MVPGLDGTASGSTDPYRGAAVSDLRFIGFALHTFVFGANKKKNIRENKEHAAVQHPGHLRDMKRSVGIARLDGSKYAEIPCVALW